MGLVDQSMNFNEALEYLLQLGHETLAMKLGLRNTELLLEALGNPERSFLSVQIAGTNGKGSTAVMLDSICREAGTKTGLYTSPHLVSITERIKINGIEILEDQFAQYATTVRGAAETLIAEEKIEALPTFFEHVTAIALLAFRDAEVKVAILETGLGGRLDSTTTARAQLLAITQIALDHEEYLGKTIESIAAEKAAIIHPRAKVVIVADHQPPEALAMINRRCEENNVHAAIGECSVQIDEVTQDGRFCATFQTRRAVYRRVQLGLAGEHQLDNAAVAIQLAENLDIEHRAICAGLEAARHHGRLEWLSTAPPILLDGAHNLAAMKSLAAYLQRFGRRPLTVVFGAMRDKPGSEMVRILGEISDSLILTKAENIRSADPADLLSKNAATLANKLRIALTSSEALRWAIDSTPANGLIVVTGSLYLVGEVRRNLQTLFSAQSKKLNWG
jgi:dihydrofolate synthase / folylpolyglutamate synthase